MLSRGYYVGKTESEIACELCSEGTSPARVVEQPGSRYDQHTNPHDLVLAFVRGSADIQVGNRLFHCEAGDRLLINGHVKHGGLIGRDGCEYYMTMMPTMAD